MGEWNIKQDNVRSVLDIRIRGDLGAGEAEEIARDIVRAMGNDNWHLVSDLSGLGTFHPDGQSAWRITFKPHAHKIISAHSAIPTRMTSARTAVRVWWMSIGLKPGICHMHEDKFALRDGLARALQASGHNSMIPVFATPQV